jgi:hypothetical protein
LKNLEKAGMTELGEGAFHSNLSKFHVVLLGKVECRLLKHP